MYPIELRIPVSIYEVTETYAFGKARALLPAVALSPALREKGADDVAAASLDTRDMGLTRCPETRRTPTGLPPSA